MNRVFLGGTCNGDKWRENLIPLLEEYNISYFNPVVDDWNDDCIKIEEDEKDNKCDIHLFLITANMKGIYSIGEMMASATQENKKTLFVVFGEFDKDLSKSLVATNKLARKYGKNYYSHFMNSHEDLRIVAKIIKKIN